MICSPSSIHATFQAALDQAKAKLDQDTADLANAKLNLGRDTQLGQRDFLSAQTVDNQRSRVAELEAQMGARRRRG